MCASYVLWSDLRTKITFKYELVHGQSLMHENILSEENQVMVRRLRIQFVDVVVDLIQLANP